MTADVNVVKALTRVAMGLCQGRNCQRQLAALIARAHGAAIADVAAGDAARARCGRWRSAAVADASIGDEGYFTRDG